MISQLFHQSQVEIQCEANSPGWVREQPTASSPQPRYTRSTGRASFSLPMALIPAFLFY